MRYWSILPPFLSFISLFFFTIFKKSGSRRQIRNKRPCLFLGGLKPGSRFYLPGSIFLSLGRGYEKNMESEGGEIGESVFLFDISRKICYIYYDDIIFLVCVDLIYYCSSGYLISMEVKILWLFILLQVSVLWYIALLVVYYFFCMEYLTTINWKSSFFCR